MIESKKVGTFLYRTVCGNRQTELYRQMQVLIRSGGRADAKFFEKTYDKIIPLR